MPSGARRQAAYRAAWPSARTASSGSWKTGIRRGAERGWSVGGADHDGGDR